MLTKYLIENKIFKHAVVVGYSQHGKVIFYDATGIEQGEKQHRMFVEIPYLEAELPLFAKKFPTLKITKAQTDLSFPAIWEAYGYKVGGKEATAKKWNKLSEAEKIAVFNCLPKYNEYLTKTGTAKAYLETFLNQKRYENEFK